MNLSFVIGTIINGIELGLIYALIAIGFSLIYGTAKIVFAAHGEIYMIGAMLTYYLFAVKGIPYFVSLIIVIISMGIFGLIADRLLFRRLHGKDLEMFMVSLGLVMIMSSVFLLIFGGAPKGVRTPFPGTMNLMGMSLAIDKLIVALISITIIVGLHFFFHKVKSGQGIRAYAQNPEAAALQGISMDRTVPLTFFVSLALAGAAGGLVAPLYFAQVFMGTSALTNTFMVVILGGIGSFPGAIVGGLFLGLLHSLGRIVMGEFSFLLSFIVIIIFLVVKPTGFFGHE